MADPFVIVKNYEHFNRSLPNWDTPKGVYVRNKDHYDRLMKENGMVSYEKMQQQAESKKLKDYKLSNESKAIIQAAKASKGKDGKVQLSQRTIEAMIKKGAIGKKIAPYMNIPQETVGGFSLSEEQKKVYYEK